MGVTVDENETGVLTVAVAGAVPVQARVQAGPMVMVPVRVQQTPSAQAVSVHP